MPKMIKMILQVVVPEQLACSPEDTAEFRLYELAAAKEWVMSRIAWYSPTIIDMIVTIQLDSNNQVSELIPELNAHMYTGHC